MIVRLLCVIALVCSAAVLAQGIALPGVITPDSQRRALQPFPAVDDTELRTHFRVIRGYFDRPTNSYVWDLEPIPGAVADVPELIADYETGRGEPLRGAPLQISQTNLGLQARLADLPTGNALGAVERIVIRARPKT